MPGYDTHYVFGVHSYRRMPDSDIKLSIYKEKSAYTLGLLGPDIFFYYATEVVAARKNIGSLMHTEKTDKFFNYCIKYVETTHGKAKDIAISYLSGFLSHYVLDCLVHPFVYWMTDYMNKSKDYLQKHFSLETDIDILLLKTYLGVTPKEFFKNSQIELSDYQKDVISDMLHYAIRNIYENSRITKKGIRVAIVSLQKEHKVLKLISSKMKNAIGTIEYAFVGQRYLAPLIPGGNDPKNDDPLNLNHSIWFNPWDTSISSNQSVPDLLNQARERYLMIMFLLDNYYCSTNKEKALNLLMKSIGSKSYHSGLNSKIPS